MTQKTQLNKVKIPKGYYRLRMGTKLLPNDRQRGYYTGKWRKLGEQAKECRVGTFDTQDRSCIIRKRQIKQRKINRGDLKYMGHNLGYVERPDNFKNQND